MSDFQAVDSNTENVEVGSWSSAWSGEEKSEVLGNLSKLCSFDLDLSRREQKMALALKIITGLKENWHISA
jgi:hypothetical protein